MSKARGFTLVESIIVIVMMGLAMVTIINYLVPQVTRSANPHYQARAAALGESVMSMILARGFDEESNFVGGLTRCSSDDVGSVACSGTSGSSLSLGDDGEAIAQYNDVDDYIGCWQPSPTVASGCKDLNELLGENAATSTYTNFELDISVVYQRSPDLKQINLTVMAAGQTPIVLHAYKGNY